MSPLSPARAYVVALVLLATGVVLVVIADGLPWLTLAVVLGIVATRGWGRIIASALLLIGGLVAVVGGVIAIIGGSAGSGILGVAGGVLVSCAAAWTIVRGRQWPAMGGRYERDRGSAATSSRLSAWDALDRGQDPTEDLPEQRSG